MSNEKKMTDRYKVYRIMNDIMKALLESVENKEVNK